MIIRISGQFTQLLNQWLQQRHLQTPPLKQRLEQMANSSTVPVERWREVLAEASEIAPYRHFGLEVGSLVSFKHTGVLGFLVANSETLAESLRTYQLSERRFYGVNFCLLTQSKNSYRLSWIDKLGASNGLFVQVAMSTLVSFLNQRFPSTFHLQEVALSESEPENASAYSDFFGCQVTFDSSELGILLDAEQANQTECSEIPLAFSTAKHQQAHAFSAAIDSQAPFLRSLQPLLLKLILQGDISVAAVARELGCSSRTLQRRLMEFGFSYQSLLNAVREQLACRYLQVDHINYAEMALLLGYSEQSAFNRAFKQWTGVSPSSYRAQQETGELLQTSL